jgi:hypothetical protein
MTGCTKSHEQDRLEIRSRLRLKPTPIALPDSETVKLRVTTGGNTSTLWPQRVNIRRGAITFHGTNGYIRLTTNDTTVIKSDALDHEVGVKMTPDTQHVRFHLSQAPFQMSINWSTIPSLSEYCKSNSCSYVDFCPKLMSVTNGNSLEVDIPIEKTDDFEGEVTDWVIQSNWK